MTVMSTPVSPRKRPGIGWPRKKKHQGAVVLIMLACVAALIYGTYWWRIGRFVESTDDAYVRADIVTISPRVTGYVQSVSVQDNQAVHAGDLLATLDDREFHSRVEAAHAAVAVARARVQGALAANATLAAQIDQQNSTIAQAQAQVDVARAQARLRDADARRYQTLRVDQAASDQRVEQALTQATGARAEVVRAQAAAQAQRRARDVLQKRQAQNIAAIDADRAQLQATQAEARLAELALSHTQIRATEDGVIGERSARAGEYVEAGTPLMALVPLHAVYVVANLKETQIATIHPGQPVTLEVDTYANATLHGHVIGIAPGSGAEFALLPPDNATGNFTKIVQRVPVKIQIDALPEAIALRPGMSVIADINTRESRP